VTQPAIGGEGEDVDAIRVTSRGRGLPGEAGAERFPLVPCGTVPILVTKDAVAVDGEEFALSAIAPRRDGRARCERAA
jgi:hypothetical protein